MPLKLEDLQLGKQFVNIKNRKTYTLTGFGFHSENLDYLVRYQDEYGTDWDRPIGLFLLKFKRKEDVQEWESIQRK